MSENPTSTSAEDEVSSTTSTVASAAAAKTPVSLLQELYVKRGITPKYDLVQIEGAVHEPTFKYRVTVGEFVAMGNGQSKKKAKHAAAKAVLDKIRAVQKQGLSIGGHASSDGVICKKADVELIPELDVDLISPYNDGIEGNPVGELQELCMNRRVQPPIYEVSLEEGQPHERKFVIVCKVGKAQESGIGKSKKLAKRESASKMLSRLQSEPSDHDAAGCGIGIDSTESTYRHIDEDDLAMEMAKQRNAEIREKKPFKNQNLAVFFRNLKVGEDTQLAELARMGMDDMKRRGVALLEAVGEEQAFNVTYVDIEEKSSKGDFHALVQLSTVPVAVCFGTGATAEEAKNMAALDACLYLKIMTEKQLPVVKSDENTQSS